MINTELGEAFIKLGQMLKGDIKDVTLRQLVDAAANCGLRFEFRIIPDDEEKT